MGTIPNMPPWTYSPQQMSTAVSSPRILADRNERMFIIAFGLHDVVCIVVELVSFACRRSAAF